MILIITNNEIDQFNYYLLKPVTEQSAFEQG
jgi:hypothetical protein